MVNFLQIKNRTDPKKTFLYYRYVIIIPYRYNKHRFPLIFLTANRTVDRFPFYDIKARTVPYPNKVRLPF